MRHDIAIYSASSRSAGGYDLSLGREGGAERQMRLLARALAERGERVAHIIPPAREPVALSYRLTLIHLDDRHTRGHGMVDRARESLAVWRALSAADAAVTVVRTASPHIGVAGVFCKVRRRVFIFSTSNISDFMVGKMPSGWQRVAYRLGVRLADALVVQSEDQGNAARHTFPSVRRIVHIPSFAEIPTSAEAVAPMVGGEPPEAFLWFGRAVAEKQPMRFVDLARSVPEARFRMVASYARRNPGLLDDLRAAAEPLPNLVVSDPLPHAALQELIARSVAVVNTSSFEGMPNAFLEAWAHGVPVLTLQFDPDDVVARRRLGVAAAGSWNRFVSGARELWESRRERDELSRRVLSHVGDTHSLDGVGERWSALIQELRRKRSGRRRTAFRLPGGGHRPTPGTHSE